jgi:ammonium transporter Rh
LLLALSSSNGPVPPEKVLPLVNGSEDSILTKTIFIWVFILAHFMLLFYNKKYSWTAILSSFLAIFPAFIFYVFIIDVCEKKELDSTIIAKGSLCALSCAISLGMFVGTIKLLHYFIYGLIFSASFYFARWLSIEGKALVGAVDPGFGIQVHLFAAYFAAGATLVIQEKRVVGAKPTFTKNSFAFVWIASFLLYVCWPLYGSVFYTGAEQKNAAIAYLMAGAASFLGAVASDYSLADDHKLNPYTIAQSFYAGCIGVSNSVFTVGPYGALLVGIITGLLLPVFVTHVQNGITNKLGVADIMGIHNVHGLCSWISVLCGMIACYCKKAKGVWTLVAGLITFGIALVCGAITGVIINLSKCGEILTAEFQNDFVYFSLPEVEVEKTKATAEEL